LVGQPGANAPTTILATTPASGGPQLK